MSFAIRQIFIESCRRRDKMRYMLELFEIGIFACPVEMKEWIVSKSELIPCRNHCGIKPVPSGDDFNSYFKELKEKERLSFDVRVTDANFLKRWKLCHYAVDFLTRLICEYEAQVLADPDGFFSDKENANANGIVTMLLCRDAYRGLLFYFLVLLIELKPIVRLDGGSPKVVQSMKKDDLDELAKGAQEPVELAGNEGSKWLEAQRIFNEYFKDTDFTRDMLEAVTATDVVQAAPVIMKYFEVPVHVADPGVRKVFLGEGSCEPYFTGVNRDKAFINAAVEKNLAMSSMRKRLLKLAKHPSLNRLALKKSFGTGKKLSSRKDVAQKQQKAEHEADGTSVMSDLTVSNLDVEIQEDKNEERSLQAKSSWNSTSASVHYLPGEQKSMRKVPSKIFTVQPDGGDTLSRVLEGAAARLVYNDLDNLMQYMLSRSFYELIASTKFNQYTAALTTAKTKPQIHRMKEYTEKVTKFAKAFNFITQEKSDDVDDTELEAAHDDVHDVLYHSSREILSHCRAECLKDKVFASLDASFYLQKKIDQEDSNRVLRLGKKAPTIEGPAGRIKSGGEAFGKLLKDNTEIFAGLEKCIMCLFFQCVLYMAVLHLSHSDSFIDQEFSFIYLICIMSIVFAVVFSLQVAMSEFYCGTFVVLVSVMRTWNERVVCFMNLFANMIMALGVPLCTVKVLIAAGDDLIDILLNSIAIYFIIDLDDMLVSDVEIELLEEKVIHCYFELMYLKGRSVEHKGASRALLYENRWIYFYFFLTAVVAYWSILYFHTAISLFEICGVFSSSNTTGIHFVFYSTCGLDESSLL